MKKIWISPYKLKLKNSQETREGFLIKLQTEDFEAGYADCFPWQSFGDPSVQQLTEWIQPEKTSPLLRKSLFFAELDGKARAQKKKLLEPVQMKNHYLVHDLLQLNQKDVEEAVGKGFSTFKLKVGRHPRQEKKAIEECFSSSKVQIRLDFNGLFHSACEELLDINHEIEFIEDPVEDAEEWKSFKEKWKIPVALDQVIKNKQFDVQVIKPAKQSESDYLTKDVVFTSYMDHPVGQAFALYQAQQFGAQKRDYGLMSHSIYESHLFSQNLVDEGNSFSVQGEYGIGFDDLWEQVSWQRIV